LNWVGFRVGTDPIFLALSVLQKEFAMFCKSNSSLFHRLGLLALTIGLAYTPLAAHDMWIEPATFSPQTGEIIPIRLRVGQDLLGDPLPRDSNLIKQFVVEDATGSKPVVGRDGSDPAGYVFVSKPGLLVIGYRSNPSAIELPPGKFNQYLRDEGLDAVAALRAQRNATGASAHEMFARCAKSLMLSGSPSEKQSDRRLGFTLELTAERNPYLLRPGEDLPVRLTYQDLPLEGALVIAMNRLNPSERQAVRSDSDGRVHFRVHSGGLWLIKAVHMIPAPAGSNAEWASYWASLTFELRSPAAQGN
jgi:uncharacterized GH25 family protein